MVDRGKVVGEILEKLAASQDDQGQSEAVSFQAITFRLGGQLFATAVSSVRRIVPVPKIAAVPGMADHVLGVFNYRGEIVPAIDLAQILGLGGGGPAERPQMMIVRVPGVPSGVGFVLTELEDICSISLDRVQPRLASLQGMAALLVEGELRLNDQLITLLKFDALAPR